MIWWWNINDKVDDVDFSLPCLIWTYINQCTVLIIKDIRRENATSSNTYELTEILIWTFG